MANNYSKITQGKDRASKYIFQFPSGIFSLSILYRVSRFTHMEVGICVSAGYEWEEELQRLSR